MRREEVVASSKINFITRQWEFIIGGDKITFPIDNMTEVLKKDLLNLADFLDVEVDIKNTKQQIIEVMQNKINLDNQ